MLRCTDGHSSALHQDRQQRYVGKCKPDGHFPLCCHTNVFFLQPLGLSFFCLCFVGAEVILRNWHIMLLPPNAAIRLDFDGLSQVGANDVRNIMSWHCAPWEVSLHKDKCSVLTSWDDSRSSPAGGKLFPWYFQAFQRNPHRTHTCNQSSYMDWVA